MWPMNPKFGQVQIVNKNGKNQYFEKKNSRLFTKELTRPKLVMIRAN